MTDELRLAIAIFALVVYLVSLGINAATFIKVYRCSKERADND